MKEILGYWSWGHRHDVEVSIQDGVLAIKPAFGGYKLGFKRTFGERFFGDSGFLVGVVDEYVNRILGECEGKSEDEIRKIAEKYIGYRAERQAKEAQDREKWDALRKKFDGYVIGIDKKIDVYSMGFSVRVVFSSDVDFLRKSAFLKENRAEFLKWVMNEISDSKKIMGQIGDIKFYKPVEIINLRAREVEVKFGVKKESVV